MSIAKRRAAVLGLLSCLGVGAAAAQSALTDRATSLPQPTAPPDPKELVSLPADPELVKHQAEQVQKRLIARARLYTRSIAAGLLPLMDDKRGVWQHLSELSRLRHALHRDLEQERQLTRLRIELARKAREQGELGSPDTDPVLREEERKTAFRRAFQRDALGATSTAVYAALGPSDPDAHGQGFSAMQNRLPFPVAGRTEISAVPVPGQRGRGLLLKTQLAAPIRAVYEGRVAFADTYGELGPSVIVDHGGGYYTLSAGLGSVQVQVGDEVDAGQLIGTAGQSPPAALRKHSTKGGPSVYFEIRRGGDALATDTWFGL